MRLSRALLSVAALVAAGTLFGPAAHAGGRQSELRPLGQTLLDDFGAACDADTDVLVVGDPASPEGGAVVVFGRNEGRWVQRQRIVSPARAGDDEFGAAVAVRGLRLVVGAPTADRGSGAAYLYEFDVTRAAWTLIQQLEPDVLAVGGGFGFSVGVGRDVLFASAPLEADSQGAVYAFTQGLPSIWGQQSRVTPTTDPRVEPLPGRGGASFGWSIDVHDETLVVGAPAESGGDGAAYVFTRSGRNWIERLHAIGTADSGAALGWAVAFDGTTFVAGAPLVGTASLYNVGRDDVTFLETVTPPERVAAASGVAVTNDVLAIADTEAGGGVGAVHVYRRIGASFVLDETHVAGVDEYAYGSGIAAFDDTVFMGATGGHLFNGVVDVVDLRERAIGYLAPTKVSYRPGAGKGAGPGLTWTGTLDLGPDPVALTGVTVVRIGTLTTQIQALDQAAPGKPASHDDGVLSLRIAPDRKGSSRAAFTLSYRGDLSSSAVTSDGPLRVEFETAGLVAAGEVVLTGGAFSSKTGAASIVSPAVSVEKLKTVAKGAGKSGFTVTLRFPTDGSAPEAGPNVVLRYGDGFEERIDGSLFKVKKTKAIYSNGKATGLVKVIVDFKKGLVTAKAKRLDLTPAAPGPTPVLVGVTVNGLGGDASVTAVSKGPKLTR